MTGRTIPSTKCGVFRPAKRQVFPMLGPDVAGLGYVRDLQSSGRPRAHRILERPSPDPCASRGGLVLLYPCPGSVPGLAAYHAGSCACPFPWQASTVHAGP